MIGKEAFLYNASIISIYNFSKVFGWLTHWLRNEQDRKSYSTLKQTKEEIEKRLINQNISDRNCDKQSFLSILISRYAFHSY